MTDLNQVVLTGRAVRDVELRDLEEGQTLSAFRCAFSKARKNAKGEWEDVPSFINCFYIGAKPLDVRKGEKLLISGELTEHTYTTAEGQKKSDMRVFVKKLEKILVVKKEESKPMQEVEEIPF